MRGAGKRIGFNTSAINVGTGAVFSMSGHPTLTLPAGFTTAGTPAAIQLVARRLGEPMLVRAGRAFQSASDWHRRRPALRG